KRAVSRADICMWCAMSNLRGCYTRPGRPVKERQRTHWRTSTRERAFAHHLVKALRGQEPFRIQQRADAQDVRRPDAIVLLIGAEQHPRVRAGTLEQQVGARDGAELETQVEEDALDRCECWSAHEASRITGIAHTPGRAAP